MASSLDQSLDDIISSKPRNRGIRKGRRGLRTKVGATVIAAKKQVAAVAAAPKAPAGTSLSTDLFDQGSKIIVSNLPFDVTEQQIKDLFNVQIGRVSRVTLTYGSNGTSKGIATIQFANNGDAKKAYDRYDGKLIDNTRRLKIEIIMDPGRAKPALAQRIQAAAPLVAAAAAPRPARGGRGRGRRGRGELRGGLRGGLRGAGRRPKKTVDELDAEMTDYFQDSGNAATATA